MLSLKCKVIRSRRKTLALEVHRDGSVIIRAPIFTLAATIRSYVSKMQHWIEKKQKMFRQMGETAKAIQPRPLPRPLQQYKKDARHRFTERLDYYAQTHGLTYTALRLSSARTRWGSCSRKKSINLNWRLIMAPTEIIDYVIVHELSHTVHMNHSKRFWAHVEMMHPQYKIAKKWLRENGRNLYAYTH